MALRTLIILAALTSASVGYVVHWRAGGVGPTGAVDVGDQINKRDGSAPIPLGGEVNGEYPKMRHISAIPAQSATRRPVGQTDKRSPAPPDPLTDLRVSSERYIGLDLDVDVDVGPPVYDEPSIDLGPNLDADDPAASFADSEWWSTAIDIGPELDAEDPETGLVRGNEEPIDIGPDLDAGSIAR